MLTIILIQIIEGFFVKSVASFDDTLSRIPILLELTRTRKGKIAFSIGTLLALTLIIIIAIFFSNIFDLIPYRNQVVAFLILLLAVGVYFKIFSKKPEKEVEKVIAKVNLDASKLSRLVLTGFVISFITLIDDMIVLLPLFHGDNPSRLYSIIGVYLATVIQIVIVIYFSHKIGNIKYTREISSLALVFLAILVAIGII